MPCYQMNLTEIAFTAKSVDTLKKALEELGYSVRLIAGQLDFSGVNKETGAYNSGSFIDGKLTYTGKLNVESVQQSYAASMVKTQWGKHGKVIQKSKTKFVVQLRSI